MACLLPSVQSVVCVGLSIDGPTGFTSKVGSAGAQFPREQGMPAHGLPSPDARSPKPRRRPREPGVRDGSREIRPLSVAAAVAICIAVAPMAVTIRTVAVGGIAVVAVRGLAVVAIPAIRTVTIVAVAIGGGLGGGEACRAERGGGGDRDEGLLEGVHVHVLQKSVEPGGATNEDNMARA